jgi:hypothetical protein
MPGKHILMLLWLPLIFVDPAVAARKVIPAEAAALLGRVHRAATTRNAGRTWCPATALITIQNLLS